MINFNSSLCINDTIGVLIYSSDWHLQNAEQGKFSSLQGHREAAHFIQL